MCIRDRYSILVRDKEQRESILTRLKENPCQVFHKAPLITIIHPEASKKEGVLQLCKALGLASEYTLVVGNSLKDWPMTVSYTHLDVYKRQDYFTPPYAFHHR